MGWWAGTCLHFRVLASTGPQHPPVSKHQTYSTYQLAGIVFPGTSNRKPNPPSSTQLPGILFLLQYFDLLHFARSTGASFQFLPSSSNFQSPGSFSEPFRSTSAPQSHSCGHNKSRCSSGSSFSRPSSSDLVTDTLF